MYKYIRNINYNIITTAIFSYFYSLFLLYFESFSYGYRCDEVKKNFPLSTFSTGYEMLLIRSQEESISVTIR